MKLRRLEKEYNEVLSAEITIKDANKFEGLAKVFGIEENKEDVSDGVEAATQDNDD